MKRLDEVNFDEKLNLKIDDSEMIEMIEQTTKMIDQGKEKIERQIEEALLLSQFVINNTIAVQEWFLTKEKRWVKVSYGIYQ